MVARAGAQTGWLEQAERNITPRDAMASRLGVRFIGFAPMAPMQSARNWSEMIRRILGRVPPCGEAGTGDAADTAIAPGTPASHLRRVIDPQHSAMKPRRTATK